MDIVILTLLGLLIIIFRIFKIGDYFSPWFITIAVWFMILLLFQFEGDLLYPIEEQFYRCFFIWIPLFLTSSLITYYVYPSRGNEDLRSYREKSINMMLFYVLYTISIVITPLYVYKIFNVVTMFDTEEIFYNLRLLAIYSDGGYGFLQYSYIVNQALFIVALWKYPQIPAWQLITIIIACLMGQVAIMEKSGMFLMTIATLFVLYTRRRIRLRSIIISVCIIFLVFFFVNILLTSSNGSSGLNFMDFFAIYVLSPTVAFGRINEELSQQFGSHTFQILYLFLKRFGADFEVNSRLQDFVWVPLPTNVYTIFEPFFRDFGYRGIAFFAFLYGTLFGWVYRLFRNGGMIARCIYAYLLKVLIMQFYNEDLIQNIVLTVQFVFFVSIICTGQLKSFSVINIRK